MCRARGLLVAIERIRNQEPPHQVEAQESQEMGGGRGLLPPSPPQVGGGRARARALLLKMTARNNTQPPTQFPIPQGGEEV